MSRGPPGHLYFCLRLVFAASAVGLPEDLTQRAPPATLFAMELEHLKALLDLVGTDEEGGFKVLKDERSLTLHLASQGVGLNVSKIRRVRTEGALLYAENQNGDAFVLNLRDVFAGSVDPANKSSRKAGFR
jgi:hypothetical protein